MKRGPQPENPYERPAVFRFADYAGWTQLRVVVLGETWDGYYRVRFLEIAPCCVYTMGADAGTQAYVPKYSIMFEVRQAA